MTVPIERTTLGSGYDRETCWVHARVGIHPSADDGAPRFVTTLQRLDLSGSDVFGPIHSMSAPSWDGPWTTPYRQEGFTWPEQGRTVCDFWPIWHEHSQTLLGTGHTVTYTDGVVDATKPRRTAYAVHRPESDSWSPARLLEMGDGPTFFRSGAGCAQWVERDDGDILLPVYFGVGRMASTVVRCRFDGETLRRVEYGSTHSTDIGRGLYEPSLIAYQGRHFLTLRNDEGGYLAVSEDGLQYADPIPWRFDDGSELGSCNTQQHWIVLADGPWLVYTRHGRDNDHVSRHRAPLLMARLDTDRLVLLRESEQVVIEERGAGLGNFGTCQGPDGTAYVMASEWMQNSGPARDAARTRLAATASPEQIAEWEASRHGCEICERFGSDNTIWLARVG
ncbi:MAG TPA: exo-alpha-sialidase [Candidatus Avipropionibacterium avicola]|uniref:Exo-alpha-sialidase n=1 Tax=Candidatus Avipropionibacterium avicola TaxID=2840701 RepID=A0A9D1KN03_9ACTN|nr:exo-alpha-sialidase [Candidatus Avipropionibacterium avicola]